ncbi:hypothetical protein [Hymenobacter psychrotolerans]|uniref:Uncharacterized protein n=1 Tax=Hymenobacter psychrotolerans DSM 18569 TaxID=1121959 RepID=A0A1M6X5U5_9BACT|nr:hypothetical protein [Hymenobacter psychrotolerans]SHL01291.1 hypothetical protein SAMN02746009_01944 [Hymenobacter psychrotolerans DSM 18569]
MKTPFRLDEHPRRPQPLAPPPAGYFDQLPMRVMQRVQGDIAEERPAFAFGWLARLAAPVRTALATTVVLGGFAGAFLLSQPTLRPATGTDFTLAAVPQSEMVQYLLASEQRVSLSDLAELPDAGQALPDSDLYASPDELQEALDAQPTEEFYL